MTIEEAKQFVNTEIARIEGENPDKELRPWHRDACPAAVGHWGRIQQRIALEGGNLNRACLTDLAVTPPERTEAQRKSAKASALRLTGSKAA